MIEQLLAHREAMPYALTIVAICLATVMGYLLGHQDEAQICASYVVEAERQTEKASQLNEELTTCKATKAGGAVLDCGPICAERVREALKNHTAIVCED
jgi:hypothetical protein